MAGLFIGMPLGSPYIVVGRDQPSLCVGDRSIQQLSVMNHVFRGQYSGQAPHETFRPSYPYL